MTSEQSHEPLLRTKLSAPQLRLSLVARPRLLSMLTEGMSRSLTLICAPPGYGKTTLLAGWISGMQRIKDPHVPIVSWFSIDEGDNDPARFLNYLVTAIENANPQASGGASSVLYTFPPPPLQTVIAILINELHELRLPICLVLDDYQFITNTIIHEAISFLLDHLPTEMHLVIATRSDPPLSLAKLRARNELIEIRAEQLRFNSQEAAEFLNQVMHLSLSPSAIADLESRTEGWIAGLQMAALSMRGREDIPQFIRSFSGSHRYILDYLTEEVVNRQPDTVQHFLLLTSILNRLCGELCDALIDERSHASQSILEYLDRANLFIVALDDGRHWYRYHPLFADILRARLCQSQPDLIPRLHIRASEWYEQMGLPNEAILHTFSAHDDEQAADLIERYGPPRWSLSDTSVLAMADQLPGEMLITRPRLGIYQSWLKISQGQRQEAIRLLNKIKQHITDNPSSSEDRWMLSLTQLLIAYITDPVGVKNIPPLPDYQAYESMPEQDLGLHNLADIIYAIILGRRGELEGPANILIRCIQRDIQAKGTTAISMAVPYLARIRLMQGRLHESAALCREYLSSITQQGKKHFYAGGSLNIILGETLREWNKLDAAEEQIREGIQANEPWKNIFSDALGYAALARVQETKGNLRGAFDTLQALETMFEGRLKPLDWESELRALKVRLWLANGDLERARIWADHFPLNEPMDPLHELDYLSLVRVRYAQGLFAEAQRILESLSRMPGLEERINRKLKINLLLASVLAGQNKMSQALAVLETCLALGEQEGHIGVFLDGKGAIRELLLVYLRSPDPLYKAYAQKLMDVFQSSASTPTKGESQPGLFEPLTMRELEVLRLLEEGYSNNQIAEQLILAVGTVKFYVHSIYEKLAVHSRTQAIAKARQLGWI